MNMHLKRRKALGRRSAALFAGVTGLGIAPLCAADVSVRFIVDSAWSDGYNAHIEIENTGSSTIDGWELSFVVFREGSVVNEFVRGLSFGSFRMGCGDLGYCSGECTVAWINR